MTDNIQDEIIDVRLPRKDYEMLRTIIDRENAYGWIKNRMRSIMVWSLAGGILVVWNLWDRIKDSLIGVVK